MTSVRVVEWRAPTIGAVTINEFRITLRIGRGGLYQVPQNPDYENRPAAYQAWGRVHPDFEEYHETR